MLRFWRTVVAVKDRPEQVSTVVDVEGYGIAPFRVQRFCSLFAGAGEGRAMRVLPRSDQAEAYRGIASRFVNSCP